jgi:pimeloyl-ACP methyl ester carboxylesterase
MATSTITVTEKFVDMSHGKTRYFEAGSGYPFILLHGAQYLGGADTWLHVMPTLGEHFRVLAPDSLNWGPGDPWNYEFSFEVLVDHVREFMDVLGIEKANIAGHSMGGWVATLIGYESPDRINKLILSDAGGTATRPLQGMVDFKVPEEAAARENVTKRLQGAGVPDGVTLDQLLKSTMIKVTDPKHGEAMAKTMKHMTNLEVRARYNTVRRLPFIKVPTLVTWGAEDKTNDISLGKELHAGIKGSKMVVFEGAGHQVPTEQPENWTREVIKFLKE